MAFSAHRAGGEQGAGIKPAAGREESQWSALPASFGEIGQPQGAMTKGQGQAGSVDTHWDGVQRQEEEAEKFREVVVTESQLQSFLESSKYGLSTGRRSGA